MFRFLLCRFSLVSLYPTAIDLYLVGLPQIAADLHANESQLHIAFSIYLAGMAATMLFAGKIADNPALEQEWNLETFLSYQHINIVWEKSF